MTSDFTHRVVYRRDERGVILDSAVVGPDDEMPEGFEESVEYQTYVPTPGETPEVDESRLTTWEGLVLGQTVDVIKDEADAQEGPSQPGGEDAEVFKRTDDAVVPRYSSDDPLAGADAGSDQTVDEVKDEADQQEGPSDPRGESSSDEGDEKKSPRRSGRSAK